MKSRENIDLTWQAVCMIKSVLVAFRSIILNVRCFALVVNLTVCGHGEQGKSKGEVSCGREYNDNQFLFFLENHFGYHLS